MIDEQRNWTTDEFVSAFPDDEYGGQFDYVHDRDEDRERDRDDVERDDGNDERR